SAVFAEDLIVLNVFPRTSWHCSGSKAAFAWFPSSRFGEPLLAHAPGPSRGHNRNFSPSARPSLRPQAANWQVACGIYPQGYRKAAAFCLIGEAFGRLVRLRLTMPV